MNGSIQIGKFLQIPIKIHWTFGLLLLFVVYIGFANNLDNKEVLAFTLYLLFLFLCVIFHEYGHALIARRYNIITKDIILSPLGGVARLNSIPEEPYKEMIIALAGPVVNLSIAVVLGFIMMVFYPGDLFSSAINLELLIFPSEFIRMAVLINLALFILNLIPAFPLDGGRVLRAILAMKYGRLIATNYASIIGKLLAAGMVLMGMIINNYTISFIGVYIYLTAGWENKNILILEILKNEIASSIANPSFTKICNEDRMRLPIGIYIKNIEKNFLVFDKEENLIGSLAEAKILEAIRLQQEEDLVTNHISKKIAKVETTTSLNEIFQLITNEGLDIVAVMNGKELIGTIDQDAISHFIDFNQKISLKK